MKEADNVMRLLAEVDGGDFVNKAVCLFSSILALERTAE